MNFDSVLQHVREGKEFFVPFSSQGLGVEAIKGSKVSKAGIGDFLKAAKARFYHKNPIAPNQADYVNWVLYDRISYAAGATIPQLFRLFVAPIGSGTKTKVDTNLEAVSTLPAPQWFNCTGISLYFNPTVAPVDLAAFFNTEYMEFWVGQKVYAEGPVDVFPQSGGIMQHAALGTMVAAATSYNVNSTNGYPSIGNMFDTRLPGGLILGRDNDGATVVCDGLIGITIPQSQTFNMQFKADGGGATLAVVGAVPFAGVGLTVSARLHGILSRGVQ